MKPTLSNLSSMIAVIFEEHRHCFPFSSDRMSEIQNAVLAKTYVFNELRIGLIDDGGLYPDPPYYSSHPQWVNTPISVNPEDHLVLLSLGTLLNNHFLAFNVVPEACRPEKNLT